MLAWTIYISFLGAAACLLVPGSRAPLVRVIALLTSVVGLGIGVLGTLGYTGAGKLQTITDLPWVPQLGIHYYLAADGISCAMVLLTGLASIAGVLFSWNINHRTPQFFAFYFVLIAGVYGVFLSADLFLFFVFYEIAIIPKYFLIAIWGSTRKEFGAMKLALYSFVGSALVLVGVLGAYIYAGGNTFSLPALAEAEFPMALQTWAFPITFIGFAILAGLWPFHTWAPTGHVAAPTAASMLLAGVVMKLGAYGALRVAMTLFPQGLHWWQTTFAVLAVIGILYAAGVALTQTDFKFVIGYSSVSHMGFVLLGLVTANQFGVSGAVLQMVSHGIIAGLLFAVVGRMVYERTHTRDLEKLENLDLSRNLRFVAIVFVLAACASMGLPGFSGFVAELTIVIGAWQQFPVLTVITGIGILVGIAFTMRALTKAFYNTAPASAGAHPYEPITVPEKAGAVLLLMATIAIGLYPRVLFDLVIPALNDPLTQRAMLPPA